MEPNEEYSVMITTENLPGENGIRYPATSGRYRFQIDGYLDSTLRNTYTDYVFVRPLGFKDLKITPIHKTEQQPNVFIFEMTLREPVSDYPQSRIFLEFPTQDHHGALFNKSLIDLEDKVQTGTPIGCWFD